MRFRFEVLFKIFPAAEILFRFFEIFSKEIGKLTRFSPPLAEMAEESRRSSMAEVNFLFSREEEKLNFEEKGFFSCKERRFGLLGTGGRERTFSDSRTSFSSWASNFCRHFS